MPGAERTQTAQGSTGKRCLRDKPGKENTSIFASLGLRRFHLLAFSWRRLSAQHNSPQEPDAWEPAPISGKRCQPRLAQRANAVRSWQLSAQEQGAGLAKPPWQQGPGCVLHPAVLIPEQKDKPRQQSRAEQPPAQVKGSEPAAWTQHKEPALGRHRDVV